MKGSRGFTIVEVLVAVVILSFGAVGFGMMLQGDAALEKKRWVNTVAFNLLGNRAEKLLAAPLGEEPIAGENRIVVGHMPFVLETKVFRAEEDQLSMQEEISLEKRPLEVMLTLKDTLGISLGSLNLVLGAYRVQ